MKYAISALIKNKIALQWGLRVASASTIRFPSEDNLFEVSKLAS